MLNKTLKPLTIICLILSISILSLTGCGLSGENGGTNGRTSNGQSGSGSGGNSEEEDLFKIKEKIRIDVERINGQKNSVSTTQISIISLNDEFREVGSSSTPEYRVIESLLGGYEIQFSETYVERLNQVVKVIFNNNTSPKEVLYAPLYSLVSDTLAIELNAKSHYVLKKLFDAIADRDELNRLLPCNSSSTNCENQDVAKANLFRQLNDAVATYTIDVPRTLNINQAVDFIDDQEELRLSVESAIQEIVRTQSPIAKGTRRNFDPLNTALPYAQYYHNVFFGLALSDIKPNDDRATVALSSLSSKISDPDSRSGYPGFTQNTSMYDLRRDILSVNIPFSRTGLVIASNNTLSLISNENTNFLTSAFRNDSHLSVQGHLLNQRGFLQSTPNGTGESDSVGWEFSPIISKAYQTNEFEPPVLLSDRDSEPDYGDAPTWLTSSNYFKGSEFAISGQRAPFTRSEFLEDMHIFSWEVNGLEVDKDPGLSLSRMNGKEYGAISFSLKLDSASTSRPIFLVAETAKWSINSSSASGTINITQPSAFYQTLSLSRDENQLPLGVQTETNLLDTPRSISRQTSDNSSNPFHGLITLSNPGSEKPLGHATENGSYMALAFNSRQTDPLDRGQGMILASELVTGNYLFSNEKYLIQGNSVEMTSTRNTLHQLNGSELHIETATNIPNNDCIASIRVNRYSISHILGSFENTIGTPQSTSTDEVFSQSCQTSGSELRIEFANIFGEPLTLRGFITQPNDASGNTPGNLINLIWQQTNQLGLIFANKEQDLNPEFD